MELNGNIWRFLKEAVVIAALATALGCVKNGNDGASGSPGAAMKSRWMYQAPPAGDTAFGTPAAGCTINEIRVYVYSDGSAMASVFVSSSPFTFDFGADAAASAADVEFLNPNEYQFTINSITATPTVTANCAAGSNVSSFVAGNAKIFTLTSY